MFENSELFNLVKPRRSVEIHLPDGRVISGPRGAAVGFFLRKLPEWQDPPIVAAIINGDLRELTFPIQMDASVQPVSIGDTDGARALVKEVIAESSGTLRARAERFLAELS